MSDVPPQVLTFRLEKQVYALPITHVQEVLEYTEITHVPKSPPFMCGVINVRGTVVPVVDLRVEFGMPAAAPTIDTCIIIIEMVSQGTVMRVGALVDAVSEVLEIDAEQASAPPELGNTIDNAFIRAVLRLEEGFAILLELDKAFSVDQLRQIGSMDRSEVGLAATGR